MDIDLTTLGLEFGGAALLGGIVGFGAKKVAKLLAIVLGIQLVVFRYLESQGIVIVDWSALSAGLISTSERGTPTYLESIISTLSVGTGFVAGFAIGYHRG